MTWKLLAAAAALAAAGCSSSSTPAAAPSPSYDAATAPTGVQLEHYRQRTADWQVPAGYRSDASEVRDTSEVVCGFGAEDYELALRTRDDEADRGWLLDTAAILDTYCPERLRTWTAAADTVGVTLPG